MIEFDDPFPLDDYVEFNKGIAFAQACFAQGDRDAQETIKLLRERVDHLEILLARVHDELHDPYGQYWGDHPVSDCRLLESLRDYIDREMGWEDV